MCAGTRCAQEVTVREVGTHVDASVRHRRGRPRWPDAQKPQPSKRKKNRCRFEFSRKKIVSHCVKRTKGILPYPQRLLACLAILRIQLLLLFHPKAFFVRAQAEVVGGNSCSERSRISTAVYVHSTAPVGRPGNLPSLEPPPPFLTFCSVLRSRPSHSPDGASEEEGRRAFTAAQSTK